MNPDKVILQTESLTKDFGALRAVDGVGLCVKESVHSIIGPNGAGKTTLFNLLTGFLKPTAGSILFLDEEISKLEPYKISKKGIARSFQITNIFPELTVHENVRIAVQSRLKSSYNFLKSSDKLQGIEEKTINLLKQVDLLRSKGQKAKNLSYGLQRNLDICISLATDPKLILLDEPTSGMDREDIKRTIYLISNISKKIPIVLIEHNIDVVLSISDSVTVLQQGYVLAEGSPLEIQRNDKVQEAYLGDY